MRQDFSISQALAKAPVSSAHSVDFTPQARSGCTMGRGCGNGFKARKYAAMRCLVPAITHQSQHRTIQRGIDRAVQSPRTITMTRLPLPAKS